MYQALYRKYRPKNFDDVVGQEVIIKTLSNAINNNKVSHAYLFTGPRGTGKTSIAKIYAKILNCEHLENLSPCEECVSCTQINNNQNIDVIEIDAASNNGVDEIREIRNKVGLVPSNSKYKIYIIDEVHMLTTQAFNALLKTLEEPPAHIIFIFATTEPHKIPRTILSRCQKFDFKKISNKNIVSRLRHIADIESIDITDDALNEIAILADGGLRDSIGMLDQAVSYASDTITLQDVHDINGTVDKSEIRDFINCILDKNMVSLLEKIETYEEEGRNIVKITQELIDELKNIILYSNVPEYFEEKEEYYENIKQKINNSQIYNYIHSLSELIGNMKNSSNNKILLEIEIIKMVDEPVPVVQVAKEVAPVEQPPIKIKQNESKVETVKQVSEPISMPVMEEETNEVEIPAPKKKEIDTSSILSEEAKMQLESVKKIRINNALVAVSQKNRNQFKEKLEDLKELLMNPDYSKLISLLFDGELKVISDQYMIFVYKTSLMAEAFNLEILAFEKIFLDYLHGEYHMIAVDENEWDTIKKEFNAKKNQYVFKDETIDIHKIFEQEKDCVQKTNIIDEMFENIVEYE